MNIFALIAFALLLTIFLILRLLFKTEKFVKNYCLVLFKQRQKSFLIKELVLNLKFDKKISNNNDIQDLTETLQNILWKKAKKFDDDINKNIFNLELLLDMSYVVWLIFFVNKNDASKLTEAAEDSKSP